ncbi:MAG: hypothetical protein CL843_04365 [Crocinitomicaceae bacterium]|nr:hypothetical protein [Crocinitomicaceae bacterium]|tara:strand:- start:147 stop:350 length:204 start_codon:yes stop_codon:yes gene_type:complete
MQNKQQLEPEGMYHIYNRANGHEQLFLHAENYRFFLEKYQHYISPIAQTRFYNSSKVWNFGRVVKAE